MAASADHQDRPETGARPAGEADDDVRYRVIVSGRVQGVWYRDSCRQVALGAGVGGWIRNNPDGTVEAALEGPAPAVDHVLSWMREGPRRAVVDRVETRAEPPEGADTFVVT